MSGPAALGTRVARRVLLLFFLCALGPIAAVIGLSSAHIERILLEERVAQLGDLAAQQGMTVFERLSVAHELAQTLAAAPAPEWEGRYGRYFKSLAVVDASGEMRMVSGQPGSLPRVSQQPSSRVPGQASLRVSDDAGARRVWLVVSTVGKQDERRALAFELNPGYLWGDLDDIPYPTSLCVVDAAREPLYCSEPMPEPALAELREKARGTATGYHAWAGEDGSRISSYRELFLQGRFGAESWLIVVSQPEQYAFGPVRVVRELVIPVGLLSLLVATLLGLVQVRRTMGPLQQLTAATKRIAARDFDTRVALARDDEFGELAQAFDTMSEQLGRQFQELNTLTQIDAVILKQLDIERIVAILLRRLQEGVRADWHFVLLATDVDATFRVHSVNAYGGISGAQTVVLLDRDEERLLAAPGGLRLEDREAGLRATAPFATLSAQSLFALPIALDTKLAGLVVLAYREQRAPEEHEVRLLRDLADRVAVALATAARDRKLDRQAHYDALTGLPNRQHFIDLLQREIGRTDREEASFALLFIDLDGFSAVNDALGHAAGDELLVQAADRLRACLGNDGIVAHLGGDEFTVMLAGLREPNDAAIVACHLIDSLSQPFTVAHAESFVAASIGIALFPNDGATAHELLRNSDMAMYRAKQRGRGTHAFFEEEMNREAQLRVALDRELRRALDERQFVLHFQPLLDLRTGRIVGAEALARWQHPVRGLVAPSEFIPVAEELGLIEQIGEWVLREACTRFVAWRTAGLPLEHVSVNVSPRQFRRRDFLELVDGVLRDVGIAPERLQLEITETVLIDRSGAADATLAQLARLGVQLAIDDFGTGYSSLSYLKRLPVTTIKLDRSFIRDVATNEDASAIARSLIAMVHALRKEIVAEGVETPEQLALLGKWACDAIQGYHLSRPVPAEEFVRFVEERAAAPRTGRPPRTVTPLATASG